MHIDLKIKNKLFFSLIIHRGRAQIPESPDLSELPRYKSIKITTLNLNPTSMFHQPSSAWLREQCTSRAKGISNKRSETRLCMKQVYVGRITHYTMFAA